jgi:hypothetical protein
MNATGKPVLITCASCGQKYTTDAHFYRWRKYPEEKPEKRGVYQIRCDLHKGYSLVGTWLGYWRVFDGKEWRTDIKVTHFTNLTPIEDK